MDIMSSVNGWYGQALDDMGYVLFNECGWDVMGVSVLLIRISKSPMNYPSCSKRSIDFSDVKDETPRKSCVRK